MSNAKRDQNERPVLIGVSSTDNITPIMARVDSVTGYLLATKINSSNSATSLSTNKRDQNDVPTCYGISSVDGTTLVPIRTDTNGYLLCKQD